MRYFFMICALLMTALALPGCEVKPTEVRVTDTEDNPIEGAAVHVWSYSLDPADHDHQASEIETRSRLGEKLPGWTRFTGAGGKANFDDVSISKSALRTYDRPYSVGKNRGMPTGRTERYRIGRYETTTYPDGTKVTRKVDDPSNSKVPGSATVYSSERPIIAITVVATGYETKTITITGRPTSDKIQLKRKPAEQLPNVRFN